MRQPQRTNQRPLARLALCTAAALPIGAAADAQTCPHSWDTISGSTGGGISWNVIDIAEYDDGGGPAIYVAGEFPTAGGQNIGHGIARWEGTQWSDVAGYVALAVALLLLLDAALLPGLTRRCRAAEGEVPPPEAESAEAKAPPRPGVLGVIDRVMALSGEFVAYWSVIAVFAYYYEVLARYLFNSPTNWVHEGMFLMFGMFYLISGGYAYMTDSHVRVDIFYARMSARGKALTDILTSVFFFIFAGTLLVTGWIFMMDSAEVGEVSFTEWGIQYWPVKITIVVGAVLLLVQGLVKLAGDVLVLARGEG